MRRFNLPNGKRYRSARSRRVDAKGGLLAAAKDRVALVVSIAAFCISVFSFIQLQLDRADKGIEERPRVGWKFIPFGLKEAPGFYIRNTGAERALIANVRYSFVSNEGKLEANQIFDSLNLKFGEYFLLKVGQQYTLEPGEETYLYVFTKGFTGEEAAEWDRYMSFLVADVCYCDAQVENCWSHRVAMLPTNMAKANSECTSKNFSELRRAYLGG